MDTHVAAGTALALTRIIPAPTDAVFKAWIEPEIIKTWFGPYDMTVPEAEVDARKGGRHFTLMRDANGKDYPNPMTIEEIVPGKRLVLRVPEGSSCPLPGAVGTLDFLPDALGTRLEVRWNHPTAAMRQQHEEMGFYSGWQQTLDKLSAAASTPVSSCGPAMAPSREHGWLHRMLGDWTYEHECVMPDGRTEKAEGTERVRALGPYWVIGEGAGTMPGGAPMKWVVTMGYDAAAKKFRGSWIGSMMGAMFVYEGELAEDGKSLPLISVGPAFDGNGLATYRDTATIEDDGSRRLTSAIKGQDGSWTQFMAGTFLRAR